MAISPAALPRHGKDEPGLLLHRCDGDENAPAGDCAAGANRIGKHLQRRRADCRQAPGSGRRTEEQASSVEQTAASMEQITATVKIPRPTPEKRRTCLPMRPLWSKNNGEMMKQVTSKMRLINETSNRMSDIIDLIDAIAFQTNILALNAAVEAARQVSMVAALRWWR